jgi:hypothetical protein
VGIKQGRGKRLREWADNQSLGGELTPRWRFRQFDPEFTFEDGFLTVAELRGLLDALAGFELLTWDEITAMGQARNCHGVKP